MSILNKTHLIKALSHFPKIQEKLAKTSIVGAAYLVTGVSKVLREVVILNRLDPDRNAQDKLYNEIRSCFEKLHDSDFDSDFKHNFWIDKKFKSAQIVKDGLSKKEFLAATNLSNADDSALAVFVQKAVTEEVPEQLPLFTKTVEQAELKVAVGTSVEDAAPTNFMESLETLIQNTDDPKYKDFLTRQYTHQEDGLRAPTRNFAEIARLRRTSLA